VASEKETSERVESSVQFCHLCPEEKKEKKARVEKSGFLFRLVAKNIQIPHQMK